jgi:hypothetical protein
VPPRRLALAPSRAALEDSVQQPAVRQIVGSKFRNAFDCTDVDETFNDVAWTGETLDG